MRHINNLGTDSYRSGRLGHSIQVELVLVERPIEATALQQLVMGAVVDQPSALQDQDHIRGQDRGEAVGDHERRPTAEERPQRRLDELLRERVEVGRGLVQDDNARVLQDHPGDRHALLLAAAEPVAALADDGVVSVGQRTDELLRVGRAGRGLDLFLARLGPCVQEVVAHRRVEEERVLEDHAEVLAE